MKRWSNRWLINLKVKVSAYSPDFGRSGKLLISRVVEQFVIGLCGFLAAWRVGAVEFAPVSALLIFNSVAVVCSDFGLGPDVLARPIGSFGTGTLTRVRLINIVFGLTFIGFTQICTIAIPQPLLWTLIWALSAEAFVRKSALLRLSRVDQIVTAEILGAGVFAIFTMWAIAQSSSIFTLIGIGLVLKHLAESLLCRGWNSVFGASELNRWDINIWFSSVLNIIISNIDFVIIAVALSSVAFSFYSLGYRIAALLSSQLSYVINRVSLVDFGASQASANLNSTYSYRRRQLFVIGLISIALTIVGITILATILGREWRPAIYVALILTIVLPWRMCGGIVVSVAIAMGRARALVRWEVIRLTMLTLFLSLAALHSFGLFVAISAVGTLVTTISYDRLAQQYLSDRTVSILARWSPAAILGIVLLSVGLPL